MTFLSRIFSGKTHPDRFCRECRYAALNPGMNIGRIGLNEKNGGGV